ncbi:MAG: hypothetical protein KGI52_10360 [Burkholderiales bacterium]|nr:hypothetical protein [Burkholderiales bacterium]
MTKDEIADAAEAVGHVFLIPGTWARKAYARDKRGACVSVSAPEACAWCVAGAIRAATDCSDHNGAVEYTLSAWLALNVSEWNDLLNVVKWSDAPGQTAENIANELFNFADAMRASSKAGTLPPVLSAEPKCAANLA